MCNKTLTIKLFNLRYSLYICSNKTHTMTKRFEKAYNALLKAFMDDTLAKGTCTACAVGNIVADAMGTKVVRVSPSYFVCNRNNNFWSDLFVTDAFFNKQKIYNEKSSRAKYIKARLKKLTGYSWKELAKIEHVFETNTKVSKGFYPLIDEKEIMEDQFNGLMAVLDVMIELDEIKEGKQYKDAFKKKLQNV